MAWFAQNNTFGGVSMVQAEEAPTGYLGLTEAQAEALAAGPPGTTIDANGSAVLPPTPSALAQAQATAIKQFYLATRQLLLNGFSSSALGSAHTYPSNPTDQANLHAAALCSYAPPTATGWTALLWCANSSGNWALTAHTAAQARQALADWVTFRGQCAQALASAVQTINVATTVAAVQAVTLG